MVWILIYEELMGKNWVQQYLIDSNYELQHFRKEDMAQSNLFRNIQLYGAELIL